MTIRPVRLVPQVGDTVRAYRYSIYTPDDIRRGMPNEATATVKHLLPNDTVILDVDLYGYWAWPTKDLVVLSRPAAEEWTLVPMETEVRA